MHGQQTILYYIDHLAVNILWQVQGILVVLPRNSPKLSVCPISEVQRTHGILWAGIESHYTTILSD